MRFDFKAYEMANPGNANDFEVESVIETFKPTAEEVTEEVNEEIKEILESEENTNE